MHNWQSMFVNFAISVFILQIIMIFCVFYISKFLPTEKTDKEFLEEIYKQQTSSGYYFQNLKFK